MEVYIRSAACISPQHTFNNSLFLNEFAEYPDGRLTCIEPDYDEIIAPKLSRRMSRIIKMSVACALKCLGNAGVTQPDAIVTGTAYGCLEDTGTFLTNMIEFDEEPLSPMAFVQSTHNTIGAQIALLIKSTCYNNTFVSGGASFENTLIDATMLLTEADMANILVGGMDEITNDSYTILTRAGLYKRNPVSNLDLFKFSSKGTVAGEGAAFFLLTNSSPETALAKIEAVTTFYKPGDVQEIVGRIQSFLAANAINSSDIDLLIAGNNGDTQNDEIYTQVQQSLFGQTPSINYKNLCGEYPTSTAFALWLAANIVKTNYIPDILGANETAKNKINKVLIYNHYQNIYHSLILITSC